MSKKRASPPATPASLRSERLRSRRFVAPLPSVWVLVSVMRLACPVEADSGIRNDPDPTLRRPSRFATAEDSVAVAHVILAERPVALLGGLGPSRTARSRLYPQGTLVASASSNRMQHACGSRFTLVAQAGLRQ